MTASIQHLCLVFAMAEEARGVISELSLSARGPLKSPYPMRLYRGKYQDLTISVVLAGQDQRYEVDYVGTEPATLMAQSALEILTPDLIITTGTAGGFASQKNKVGDIIISKDYFVYHDHHVPLPGLHDSALGRYPALNAQQLCADLQFDSGIISSGSSLAKKLGDIDTIVEFSARAKDMEAAAVAWVAMLHEVPCMAVKAITNLVDQQNKSEDEFLANFKLASQSLTKALVTIIQYMNGKSLADLAA